MIKIHIGAISFSYDGGNVAKTRKQLKKIPYYKVTTEYQGFNENIKQNALWAVFT